MPARTVRVQGTFSATLEDTVIGGERAVCRGDRSRDPFLFSRIRCHAARLNRTSAHPWGGTIFFGLLVRVRGMQDGLHLLYGCSPEPGLLHPCAVRTRASPCFPLPTSPVTSRTVPPCRWLVIDMSRASSSSPLHTD